MISDKELTEACNRLHDNEEFHKAVSGACPSNSTCFRCQYSSICMFEKLLDTAYREGLDVFKTIENADYYLVKKDGVDIADVKFNERDDDF